MGRITIKRNPDGSVTVIGNPVPDNGFFEFSLGKVLAGKATEISWEPIVGLRERKDNDRSRAKGQI